MAAIQIRPVTSKKELMQFIKLPWKIYQDDPYWVPPLLIDRKDILSKKKNPFYKNSRKSETIPVNSIKKESGKEGQEKSKKKEDGK